MQYPTAQELSAMGVTLQRDVCLCSDDLRAWFGRVRKPSARVMAEKGEKHGTFKQPLGGRRIA